MSALVRRSISAWRHRRPIGFFCSITIWPCRSISAGGSSRLLRSGGPPGRGNGFSPSARRRATGKVRHPTTPASGPCGRGGLIRQEAFAAEEAAPTDFFQAGACLINRQKFLELGGFPDIYHPGYWEDYDLAWQAHRRGWASLYEPRAIAYHWGKGSMRRLLGDWGVSLVIRRNHLLFTWANLEDFGLLARHLLGLPRLILSEAPREGEAGWDRALWAALGRLPRVMRLRRERRSSSSPVPVADREILEIQ